MSPHPNRGTHDGRNPIADRYYKACFTGEKYELHFPPAKQTSKIKKEQPQTPLDDSLEGRISQTSVENCWVQELMSVYPDPFGASHSPEVRKPL